MMNFNAALMHTQTRHVFNKQEDFVENKKWPTRYVFKLGLVILLIKSMGCTLPPSECPPKQGFDAILRNHHFRAIPIEIMGDRLGMPIKKKHREGLIDSAKMCIKVENEILYLGDAYDGILEDTKIKYYVTRNENICPGRYFYQALQEFLVQDNCTASIWFHVYDGESDSLYMKWIEYGKKKSDFFGLEYLFHRK